ncbi:MAG: LysR family transcriptional regulator [Alphaproteobacteria bacterium]|nr:LysR family transcriptional regulator [Alphaproteobacteria bacterium]
MPSTAPSLGLIEVFAKVAERGGFTAAARELGVSKATASKQVAELEAQLGVRLFNRSTRSLALTEAGAQALKRAQRILEEADGLCEDAATARQSPRGRLRVAAPLTFGLDYLAPLLPDFLTRYPDLSLDLALDDRRVDLVSDGYDLAVRISELADSSLVARQLAPVRLVPVAAPAFWDAHGRPQRPNDLAALPSFLYLNAAMGDMWRFTHPSGERASVRGQRRLAVNNGAAERPALLAGLGVALLPDMIVWRDVMAGALEIALPDWTSPPLTLHVLTDGRDPPRKVRVFQELMSEAFGGGRAPWLALWRAHEAA